MELTTKLTDTEAVGVFHFVNAGDTTITITSVVPGCGCTTAELAKRVYAPGEAGEIKAVLTIGDRAGLQEKTVQVTTDEAPTTPTPLTLRVTIPELINHSTRLLLWRTAEILTEKSVIITNTSLKKIVTIEPFPPLPNIGTARIEAIEPGTQYRVAILPTSIAKPASHRALRLKSCWSKTRNGNAK